mgnify:CR=1 FL=1
MFAAGIAEGGDTAAAFEDQLISLFFNKTNHHGAVQPLPVEVAEGAGVETPLVAFGSPDDFNGFSFWRTADGACGQQPEDDFAHVFVPVFRHLSCNFGTDLEQATPPGVNSVNVAEALNPHPFCYPVQIVAQQVNDGEMLGAFFHIIQNGALRIRQGCVNGAFHRIGSDTSYFDFYKTLRRKNDEAVIEPQLEFCLAERKYFHQTQVGADGRGLRQVEQVGIATQNFGFYGFKSRQILLEGYGIFFKIKILRDWLVFKKNVPEALQVEAQVRRVHFFQRQDEWLPHVEVNDEQEGEAGLAQPVHFFRCTGCL